MPTLSVGSSFDVAQTLLSAASRLVSTLLAGSVRSLVSRAHYLTCQSFAVVYLTNIRRENGSSRPAIFTEVSRRQSILHPASFLRARRSFGWIDIWTQRARVRCI